MWVWLAGILGLREQHGPGHGTRSSVAGAIGARGLPSLIRTLTVGSRRATSRSPRDLRPAVAGPLVGSPGDVAPGRTTGRESHPAPKAPEAYPGRGLACELAPPSGRLIAGLRLLPLVDGSTGPSTSS